MKFNKQSTIYYDLKAFIKYSNHMQDVYKGFGEYNPRRKRKMLIFSYDIVADMISNKNLNSIVTELFIRGRKHFSCFYYAIIFEGTKRC